jgi:hypothetical protein
LLTRTGVTVPYSSLHRFVVKHCGFGVRGRITVRAASGHEPDRKHDRKGEQAKARELPISFPPRQIREHCVELDSSA